MYTIHCTFSYIDRVLEGYGCTMARLKAMQLHRRKSVYLNDKVSASEVCYSSRKSGPTPHKSEKQGPLSVGEGFHHIPKPLDERSCGFNPFIRGNRFQKMKGNIRAATDLKKYDRKQSAILQQIIEVMNGNEKSSPWCNIFV